MSNLVIVAIPDENDRVWKVSSEKIPHLTLLFLGDTDQVAKTDQIVQFVEHAANTTLQRFYLPVDRRDEIGDDENLGPADALFFKKGRYDYKAIRDFRVQLLKDNTIRTAFDSAKQHDGPWLPHLTLGYEKRPAKPVDEDHDYPFYDVSFNKIAVWVDEYDGPEFLLKDYGADWETMEAAPLDMAMSDATNAGAEFILQHYGVKGMRWGVQKADETKGKWLDPQGRSLVDDVTKVAAGVIFPPFAPLTLPAQVRLVRAAHRGRQAKKLDKKAGLSKEDSKFESVAKSQDAFLAIHNGATAKMNRDIEGINKKYSSEDMAVPEKRKQYDDEVKKSMQDAYRESANSLGNKTGTKHLDVEFKNDGTEFAIKVKDGRQKVTVEHAAVDDDTLTLTGKIKRETTGYIQSFEFDDFAPEAVDSLAQQDSEAGGEFLVHKGLMTPDDFIAHFGVKGMRWGQRREAPTAVEATSTSKVPHGARRKTKIKVEGGENHPAHDDAVVVAEARAKLKKSGSAALSNNELRTVAQRLQLETQVAQLTSSKGQKFIQRQFEQQAQQGVQTGVRKFGPTVVKKGAKKAGKAAATTAVTVALL